MAENLLLKHQLIVLRRGRRRAPNLTRIDRMLCGLWSLFLNPRRIRTVAIAFRPSTLLAFHQALVRGKYRRLFSSTATRRSPGRIGTMRREFLDHVLFWNTRDLERKLAEFKTHYLVQNPVAA